MHFLRVLGNPYERVIGPPKRSQLLGWKTHCLETVGWLLRNTALEIQGWLFDYGVGHWSHLLHKEGFPPTLLISGVILGDHLTNLFPGHFLSSGPSMHCSCSLESAAALNWDADHLLASVQFVMTKSFILSSASLRIPEFSFYCAHYDQLQSFFLMCYSSHTGLCNFLCNERTSLCEVAWYWRSGFMFLTLGLAVVTFLWNGLVLMGIGNPHPVLGCPFLSKGRSYLPDSRTWQCPWSFGLCICVGLCW